MLDVVVVELCIVGIVTVRCAVMLTVAKSVIKPVNAVSMLRGHPVIAKPMIPVQQTNLTVPKESLYGKHRNVSDYFEN